MSLRSVAFTSSGTWTVPTGVSFVWATMIGGGGGGAGNRNESSAGGIAGGSGEFCNSLPIPVVSGAVLAVTVGAGGAGGVGHVPAVMAQDGTPTTFGGFSVLPGIHAAWPTSTGNPDFPNVRGTGGGPNGGAQDQSGTGGRAGTGESPTGFGGASGGGLTGGGSTSGRVGGQAIGEWNATPGSGAISPSTGGGSAGGNAIFNEGADGPNAPNANGLDSGGGGTGGSGSSGTSGARVDGGRGGDGLVWIFWMQP